MTLTRKDVAATGLTALGVLTFVASHQAWDVPLVGSSHRWAAAVILVLGLSACALGTVPPSQAGLAAVIGAIALVFGVLALITGSLTPLSILMVACVALWALATFRHVFGAPAAPMPT